MNSNCRTRASFLKSSIVIGNKYLRSSTDAAPRSFTNRFAYFSSLQDLRKFSRSAGKLTVSGVSDVGNLTVTGAFAGKLKITGVSDEEVEIKFGHVKPIIVIV